MSTPEHAPGLDTKLLNRARLDDLRGPQPAAVVLLVEHGRWIWELERAGAIEQDGDLAYVDWSKARQALDEGRFDAASPAELGILRLAVALGAGDFELSSLDGQNKRLVLAAMTAALNL